MILFALPHIKVSSFISEVVKMVGHPLVTRVPASSDPAIPTDTRNPNPANQRDPPPRPPEQPWDPPTHKNPPLQPPFTYPPLLYPVAHARRFGSQHSGCQTQTGKIAKVANKKLMSGARPKFLVIFHVSPRKYTLG